MITDIVVTTRNRLDYLKRTLAHIQRRTRSPYRLHVIDDASEQPTIDFLMTQWRKGIVHDLILRNERQGQMANYNIGAWLGFSDPMVFCDDDILCPDVDPCWLTRGLEAMRDRPRLSLLALHHPGAKHKVLKKDGAVTHCRSVGGTFVFARRQFLLECPLPHKRYNFSARPTEVRCKMAAAGKWDVGFLANVYCYHIGEESAILPGTQYQGKFVPVADWKTLTPKDDRYK